jgi:DNA-binding GntR family transcriptional regulator
MPDQHASEMEAADAVNATTATRVAAELRKRILHGQLTPGSRLKLEELSSQLDVSHMPVREALRELEGEGLLELYPHRGAVIKGVDAQFVRNPVRRARRDRGHAHRALRRDRSTPPASASSTSWSRRTRARPRRTTARACSSPTAPARRDQRVGNNPEALRMLARGRVLVDALRLRYGFGQGRAEAVVAEHRTLMRAIERHDGERAGGVARRHCMRARDDLLARMRAT